MLNCEKNYKVVFFYLFTYNLACLNQILFGKEYCKFDTFCLFWMETKSTTDSENPGCGEVENFWLIDKNYFQENFSFQCDFFQKTITYQY